MPKIAVLGYGVVGSGVAEVIYKNGRTISGKISADLEIKYILARRDYPGDPFESLIIKDFSIIENDPEVAIVAECIGGCGAALDYVRRSLLAGKSVVTSNKELIAEHGFELLAIARERNLNLLFEASVGGGIPILRPLNQCLAANELSEVYGILNGTTNYILSKMIRQGLPFDQVLKDAQQKGYAEADPTADIEGFDACRKICILAALSFGRHVYPRQVKTTGITAITADDIAFAAAAGMKVKLLGRAMLGGEGKLVIYVAPHMMDQENQLANVEDVFNAIIVKGDAIGDVMFYGKGAGKLPTASAVVADLIDASKHINARKYIFWEEGSEDYIADPDALPMRWFVRAAMTEEEARSRFGKITVIPHQVEGQTGFITEAVSRHGLDAAAAGCRILSAISVLD